MKLRLHGASIRLRLDPDEVARLAAGDDVKDELRIGDAVLGWAVEGRDDADAIAAEWIGGRLAIVVPRRRLVEWAGSDAIVLDGRDDGVGISIEKDLGCRHRDDRSGGR